MRTPSRLSTPYLRSKPVAMASDVKLVDITASARMPGVSVSTATVREGQVEVLGRGDAADQHDERDDHRQQELLAVAQQQPGLHPRVRQHHPRQRRGARGGR